MAALASSLASLTITPLSSATPSRSCSTGTGNGNGASLLRIECSSHPQKKATAHHNKSRPKKRNPYDKNRHGPTVYKRLPKAPPIWGFDTSDLESEEGAGVVAEASATTEA
ncbi:hypothetical protein M758_1G038100 [Ceratodon purpureus]|uniref:50S ribosomal protein 6, chloroplastic n=1 Tax=Ceratodon purpureus TaxID=3225 RepID=A0A8T0J3A0_CERPU|nr:hypothetical protein KC19_1G040100 [Ceratodon purpureus]KAG0628593.1 hypothetical protein M758_1G038100 [Ceratodon purpureus]